MIPSKSIALAVLALTGFTWGQASRRCDLLLNYSPPPGASNTCMDLRQDSAAGGPVLTAAGNVTRIAHDGIRFCKNVFQLTTSGQADIVFLMDNTGSMQYGDVHFCSFPGDPTFSRDDVIRNGMDQVRNRAIAATAGFISFNGPDTTGIQKTRLQPLLNVSRDTNALLDAQHLANLNQLKGKVIADSGIGPNSDSCNRSYPISTDWRPAFDLALAWLADTSRSISRNHALVLISDGAVNDYGTKIRPLALAGNLPPVYGIHLGDSLDNQGLPSQAWEQLEELTQLTTGQFYRISPTDTAALGAAMDSIIFRLVTRPVPPQSLTVRNTVSGQTSRARVMTPGTDGNMRVELDSALTLVQGANTFQVDINLTAANAVSYRFRAQAGGAAVSQGTGLACYNPASLALLNSGGTSVTSYAPGTSSYSVRLTRSPAELSTVRVSATSRDPARAGWGDSETLSSIPVSATSDSFATHQSPAFPLNGSASSPVPGNGVLESDANGRVAFRWVHPRDPRDTARLELGLISSQVSLQRLVDVARGLNVPDFPPNADPVVVRGGVTFTSVSEDSTRILSTGTCVYNCNSTADNLTRLSTARTPQAPSFVFKSNGPFRFDLHLYDNLGRFVHRMSGSVAPAAWQNITRDAQGSRPVVFSLVPVGKGGTQLGTGVYVLRASITTETSGETRNFTTQFGYMRP